MTRGPSREEMLAAALRRGDAHERLGILLSTDTKQMTPDELAKHQADIRQAMSDKALGA